MLTNVYDVSDICLGTENAVIYIGCNLLFIEKWRSLHDDFLTVLKNTESGWNQSWEEREINSKSKQSAYVRKFYPCNAISKWNLTMDL